MMTWQLLPKPLAKSYNRLCLACLFTQEGEREKN